MMSPQKSHTVAAAEFFPTSIGTASSCPGSAPLILVMKLSRRSPPMKPTTTSSERDDLGLLVAESRGSVVDIHEVYQPGPVPARILPSLSAPPSSERCS